jgi:hypothetical protein
MRAVGAAIAIDSELTYDLISGSVVISIAVPATGVLMIKRLVGVLRS